MTDKVSKKELKEPDFLQVKFRWIITYLLQNKSKAYFMLAIFCMILAGAAGWSLYRMNYEKSALRIYNQVEDLSLQNRKNSDKGDIIEGFRNLASQYPNSQAGFYAHYHLGNLYFQINKIELSIRAYDEFIKRAPNSNNYLKVLANRGKGYCYETKRDYKEALSSFQASLEISESNIFEGQIFRDIGRVYEEMNDKKKALEYYRKSIEKTKDPTMIIIIKRKIASLS